MSMCSDSLSCTELVALFGWSGVAGGLAPWRQKGVGCMETPIGERHAQKQRSRSSHERSALGFFARDLTSKHGALLFLGRQACLGMAPRPRLPAAAPSQQAQWHRRTQRRCTRRSWCFCSVLPNPQPPSRRDGCNISSVAASPPPPPPTASATALHQQLRRSDRIGCSGFGERSGVAHGVRGVWQRLGRPQPPSQREVGKPASVCGLATADRSPRPPSPPAAAPSRRSQRHRQRQRPC